MTKKWLSGSPPKEPQSNFLPEKVTFESLFGSRSYFWGLLWGRPRKSLCSHFWVTIPPTIYRTPKPCCGDCCGNCRGNSGCWREVLGELPRRLPGGRPFLWGAEKQQSHRQSPRQFLQHFPPAPRISLAVSAAVSAAGLGESGLGGPVDGRGNGNFWATLSFSGFRGP